MYLPMPPSWLEVPQFLDVIIVLQLHVFLMYNIEGSSLLFHM